MKNNHFTILYYDGEVLEMKKKCLIILLMLVFLIAFMSGCKSQEVRMQETATKSEETQKSQEPITIEFCFRDGIPALTVAKLMKDNPVIDENINIDFEIQKSPDLLVTKILKEEADIAIVPSNLAAQAYNKGLSYKLMGTATWGSMYLVSTEDVEGFEDLIGKEVCAFGKGLTPDLVLRFVLSQNGIQPDEDVKITYLNAASEVGPAFLSGKFNLALLSEPLATNILMKKEDAKIVLDLNEEWSHIAGTKSGFPQASLIMKSDLIENNKEFVDEFIKLYEESIKWAKENPEELGDISEELELGVGKEPIIKGIERMNIGSFSIEDSREEYNVYFEAIMDFSPDFIGGKIPDEDLFFER